MRKKLHFILVSILFFNILSRYERKGAGEIAYAVFAGNSIGLVRKSKNLPWGDDYDIIVFDKDADFFAQVIYPELEKYGFRIEEKIINNVDCGVKVFGPAVIVNNVNNNESESIFQCDVFYSYFDENKYLKNITTDSFTISAWVNFDDFIQDEQYIVSFPGFNSGISIQPDSTLRFNFWGKDKKYYFDYKKLKPNQWHHIVANVDFDNNKLSLYVDTFLEERKIDSVTNIKLPVWDYTNDKIYIGCGSHGKNLFKGKLANLLIFDYTLTDTEIKNIYLNGLIKNKVLQTKFEPTLKYQFNNFYKNFVIDGSVNHNHATVYNTQGSNYSEYIGKDEIIKTTKISVPKRIEATFQSLPHNNDINIVKRYKSYDPDIIENGTIFFNDILTKKFSTSKIGLNNLKFKLVKEETFDKNTEWYKIIL